MEKTATRRLQALGPAAAGGASPALGRVGFRLWGEVGQDRGRPHRPKEKLQPPRDGLEPLADHSVNS
jgi:hypothetical protein